MQATGDPAKTLEGMKSELSQVLAQLEFSTKKSNNLKTDVEGFEKNINDSQQALTQYSSGLKGWEAEKAAYTEYQAGKLKMVECALPNKAAIDAIIAEYDKKITDLENEITTALEPAATRAETENAEAQNAVTAKQKDLENLRGRQKKIAEWLADLKGLKTSVEQHDDKREPAKMYFLLLEMKRVLDKIYLPPPDKLDEELDAALDAVEAARKTAREKKAVLEEAKWKLDEARTRLEKWKSKRRENILQQVNGYTTTPTTAPGSRVDA